MSDVYCIDTSALVDLKNLYPRHLFPGLWLKLEELIAEDRLIAPDEVLRELQQIDDDLYNWAHQHRRMFQSPNEALVSLVQGLVHQYPRLTKERGRLDADPWVVAVAIHSTTLDQRCVVISHERYKGGLKRIPEICEQEGLDCVRLTDLFGREGWQWA
jgi:hypothetical protein